MGVAEYRVVGDYAIGSILYKGMIVEFLIDAADLERVKPRSWHMASNSYIATSCKVEGGGEEQPEEDAAVAAAAVNPSQKRAKRKELYLHTFLLNPGPNQTVHHISKNGLDNRRCNLKLIDAAKAQAAAAASATLKKKRNVELPPMCGIRPVDIPRHIWYVQANGYHRDRFAIEFKSEGILWKSTSSKNSSLQEKLQQAKAKLQELYETYPHLDTSKEEELAAQLQSSFETALAAAAPAAAAAPSS